MIATGSAADTQTSIAFSIALRAKTNFATMLASPTLRSRMTSVAPVVVADDGDHCPDRGRARKDAAGLPVTPLMLHPGYGKVVATKPRPARNA